MSGALKPYPKYKESGVEWLGAVPEGWEVLPLRAKLPPRSVKAFGPRPDKILSLSYGSIRVRDPSDFGGLVPESFETYQVVERGDIVLRLTDLQNDKRSLRTALSNDRGLITSAYIVIVPSEKNRFFAFQMHAIDLLKLFYRFGGGVRQTMKYADLKYVPLAVPPLPEQQAIADYLDAETQRIDTLIAELREMIRLLKEKRQALISHCVTKGLDPTVPMKDSGVEWLGEVPEGWDVAGFRHFLESIVDYRGRTPTKTEAGVRLITARNLRNGRIDYESSQEYMAADEYEQFMSRGKPRIGDILMTTEAPLGSVAQVDNEYIGLAQRIMKFSGDPSILSNDYLAWFLMSSQFQDSLHAHASGSTALGIKSERLGYLRIIAPPLEVQAEIVTHLDRETAKIDRLISETEETITLMQERRSALISSVVTGKLQVPDLPEPSGSTLNLPSENPQ